jgi:hypothetical protein
MTGPSRDHDRHVGWKISPRVSDIRESLGLFSEMQAIYGGCQVFQRQGSLLQVAKRRQSYHMNECEANSSTRKFSSPDQQQVLLTEL